MSDIVEGAISKYRRISHRDQLATSGYKIDYHRFESCFFENCDLSNFKFDNVSFENCHFIKVNFSNALLENCVFSQCILTDVNMTSASLHKSRFPSSKFVNLTLKSLKKAVRPRRIIGELLRQHSEGHAIKEHFASRISTSLNLCFADWLTRADQDEVLKHWVMTVFYQHPESGLIEGLLNARRSSKFFEEISWLQNHQRKVLFANELVLMKYGTVLLCANSKTRNRVTLDSILGIYADSLILEDPNFKSDDQVEILYRPIKFQLDLAKIECISWPHLKSQILSDEEWSIMLTESVSKMVEIEIPLITEIVQYLEQNDLKNGSLLDTSCSHGELLRYLHNSAKLNYDLVGHDPNEAMCNYSKELNPYARIEQIALEDEVDEKFDVIVFRGLAEGVISEPEMWAAVISRMKNLNPKGKIIISSTISSLVSFNFIQAFQPYITKTVLLTSDQSVMSFIVLEK